VRSKVASSKRQLGDHCCQSSRQISRVCGEAFAAPLRLEQVPIPGGVFPRRIAGMLQPFDVYDGVARQRH
jgi:hypothetical protein